MNVTKLLLKLSPNEPLILGQPLPANLKQIMDILQPLINACPTQREPLFLMSKVKYLSGDIQAAISLLQKCLDQNPSFSEGHLLMAKLLLRFGNNQTASKSLEVALSHDFQVSRHRLSKMLSLSINVSLFR